MIVFDLDDTLYKERDWAIGGYRAAARHLGYPKAVDVMTAALDRRENPFDALVAECRDVFPDIDSRVPELLEIYRFHTPEISLDDDTYETLRALRAKSYKLGLITDGRSRTQRMKIEALGLSGFFDEDAIVISEEIGCGMDCKTDRTGYYEIMRRFPDEKKWVYVGDNPKKDLAMAGHPLWSAFLLLDVSGKNLHSQSNNLENYTKISNIKDLTALLNQVS